MRNISSLVVPFLVLVGLTQGQILENKHIRAGFCEGVLSHLARSDGGDALEIDSDGFEVLLFSGAHYTAKDCYLASLEQKEERIVARFEGEPYDVTVTYSLGDGPYLHKTLYIDMKPGDTIDRLQVLRFSTSAQAERGGEGQPVYIGNWFFGMDYPGFYSRHSHGFREPDFHYRWHYTIDLAEGDAEAAPRDGLVTLFHFPDHAKRQANGSFGIMSKRAVTGIARKASEGAELALMDYITETRKPARSNLHFNNWYSPEAKAVTVDSFVRDVGRTIVEKLKAHGAHLDNMVPDNGWQRKRDFDHIFQPALDDAHDSLPQVSTALEAIGTKLGIWITLDGTNNDIERGLALGYRAAYGEDFARRERWMQGKSYFDITQSKYLSDLKKALRHLIIDARVDYIKHDFNHNFTSHHLSERHAREACLDTTLELLAYERSLNPKVFQNYTNGSWFSPFWLQQVDTLWMMSGDSGGNGAWPGLSLREGATAYRDAWFFQSFNNPRRCLRPPALPIANFMTHGILFSSRKPFSDDNDTLRDWSDYCVMYFARGTLLKELYLSKDLLDDEHWKVLGRAAAWAQRNQERLVNTVFVGGDCAKGQAYGYVSWVDGRALLTVRNPDRHFQTIEVPFDASVYFRGRPAQPFKARTIYPYVEEMPWRLVSGQAFEIGIPGDSTVIHEIDPGVPAVTEAIEPAALPPVKAQVTDDVFSLHLQIPDETMPRCDLLIQAWGRAFSELAINDRPTEPSRRQIGKAWTLSAYDLRALRGQSIAVSGHLGPAKQPKLPKHGSLQLEAWLTADRKVNTPAIPRTGTIPFPIAQDSRRQTQALIPKTLIKVKTLEETPKQREAK